MKLTRRKISYTHKINAFLFIARLYASKNFYFKDGLLIPADLAKNRSGAIYIYYKIRSILYSAEYYHEHSDVAISLYQEKDKFYLYSGSGGGLGCIIGETVSAISFS